ncbi:MAG: carbohydrate-binding family 9-like protein [Anaerolineae bacterium]|nr:carbohydrate-binding family 9-like protein [Anaerolineae bacterium]
MNTLPSYTIHQARIQPDMAGARASDWGGPAWAQAETLNVSQFRPESSDARPRTQARLLYDAHGIYGMFKVEDRYVRCTHVGYQAAVYRDSCVEFFVQPKPDRGYFNFEFNCGGSLLCSYVTDPARGEGGALAEAVRLPDQAGEQVQVTCSLPQVVDPEIAEPVGWMLVFFIPFSILNEYVGPLSALPGQVWRANFYKCAEDNSHPHWAAWSPVDELNFHLPRCFGTIAFAG